MRRRSSQVLALSLLAVAALGWAGCGSSAGGENSGPPPDYAKALSGSPPPLAALHEQENDLLPGGTDAYERRIAALRGYPVVANVWASWCGPCRTEFPTLQKLAARYGKQVAFLGVNYEDSEDAAETFLDEEPVPYPSFSDPDKHISESLGLHGGVPDTAFYDRSGKLLYVKIGQYRDESELEADVRHYALQGG
jgi:cytochrome c biogenesis protein CcmG/thiol:disulfide interchange protein DsbE